MAQLKDMLKEKGLKVATVSGASDGDIIAYPLGKRGKLMVSRWTLSRNGGLSTSMVVYRRVILINLYIMVILEWYLEGYMYMYVYIYVY